MFVRFITCIALKYKNIHIYKYFIMHVTITSTVADYVMDKTMISVPLNSVCAYDNI